MSRLSSGKSLWRPGRANRNKNVAVESAAKRVLNSAPTNRFGFALAGPARHASSIIDMPDHTLLETARNTNRSTRRRFTATSFLTAFVSLTALAVHAAPRHVYLTWQGDTSRTMTINYQTFDPAEASTVYFDTKSRNGRTNAYRFAAKGTSHQIPGLLDGRKIHWIELNGLRPGETYYFIAGDSLNGFSAEQKFRTVPSGSQKLRFVIGGDIGVSTSVAPLLQQAAKTSPAFGAVGGDIAYANDALTNYQRWDAWLDLWETNMVTPSGYTIPMVLAIGNHEVRGTNYATATANFYFGYFAQNPGRSYYSRTFGENLVMFLLDSGHFSPHDGAQAVWLDAQLSAQASVPHRFAVYHVPLYPSFRSPEGGGSVKGRETWLSLFDKYHLTTAFEHHDHTFKRTQLLRANKIDTQGTLYLGDGCWGQPARKVGATRQWYEVKAASIQHFWRVDVTRSRVEYRAINKEGKVFDVYPATAAGVKAAGKVYESLTNPKP